MPPPRESTGARSVVTIDTDSRDVPPAVAEQRVRQALAPAAARHVIFKKIDSTLRGNVAEELRVLAVTARAIVSSPRPAFPRLVGPRGMGAS